MEKSSNATELVRDHFREQASSFDALYDEEHLLQRAVRPGLLKRRDFAIGVVREYSAPRVLDIGGGSGRVGELALEAGAGEYVNADIAEEMLDLSKERLARFGDKVKLVHGDVRTAPLEGPFDVVLALGFFDYQSDAHVFVRRIADLCGRSATPAEPASPSSGIASDALGSAVASFPRWNWLKGPVRKLRYEVINNCPIFNYTERELRFLFGSAGFSRVLIKQSRSGFLVRADR
jgi:SAM-dependent methyltransferase